MECTEVLGTPAAAPAPSKPPRTFAEYKEDAENKKTQFSPVKFSPGKVTSPEKKDDTADKKVGTLLYFEQTLWSWFKNFVFKVAG